MTAEICSHQGVGRGVWTRRSSKHTQGVEGSNSPFFEGSVATHAYSNIYKGAQEHGLHQQRDCIQTHQLLLIGHDASKMHARAILPDRLHMQADQCSDALGQQNEAYAV